MGQTAKHISAGGNVNQIRITNKYNGAPWWLIALLVFLCLLAFLALIYPSRLLYPAAIAIFISTPFIATWLGTHGRRRAEPVIPQGFAEPVSPAQRQATQEDVEKPSEKEIAGPDKGYVIAKPPADWISRVITVEEYAAEIRHARATVPADPGRQVNQARDVFVLESPEVVTMIPTPGVTSVDGRKLPSALPLRVSTGLVILPMERFLPPFYIEHSFEQNFLHSISSILVRGNMTLQRLDEGIHQRTKKQMRQAELRQEICDATVDGRKNANLNLYMTIIGLEGDLKDYLLVTQHPSSQSQDDPKVKHNMQILKRLLDSFRPLERMDTYNLRREIETTADAKFDDFIKQARSDIFRQDFDIFRCRLRAVDLEDMDQRNEAIKILFNFKLLADYMRLSDSSLDPLWDAMTIAKKGDTSPLLKILAELKVSEHQNHTHPCSAAATQSPDNLTSSEPADRA